MLTKNQEKAHWRIWSRVVKANAWKAQAGKMVPEAQATRENSEWHRRAWSYARGFAQAEGRDVLPDDLRHATYYMASATAARMHLGDLLNEDFTRWMNVTALLVDPDDLNAVMDRIAFDAYDRAKAAGTPAPERPNERRMLMNVIGKAPEGYVRAICKDKFDQATWSTMEINQLRQLALTVRLRRPIHPKAYRKSQEERHERESTRAV